MTGVEVPEAPRRAIAPGPRRLWWTRPVPLVLLVVPPTLLLALTVSDTEFRARYRSPRSLDVDSAQLMLIGALALALGAALTRLRVPSTVPGPWAHVRTDGVDRLRLASTVLFRITIAGYAVLLLAAVTRGLRPPTVVAALTSGVGAGEDLEAYFAPVTGVTTLTQVGVAYVVVAALLLLQGFDAPTARRSTVLLVLGLARAYLLTERLALIELAVPMVVLLASAAVGSPLAGVRLAARAAPLVLVPALVLGFSLFEASRSFAFLGAARQQSVVEYGADRLAGYYATSYNNGHLTLQDEALTQALPYFSLEALWTAPLVESSGAYEALNGYSYTSAFSRMLEQSASREFNSPGGLAIPFVDFGVPGGLVFLLACGLLVGDAAQRFAAGQLPALLLYPPLVTGLLELPRYLYWTQGRMAVPVVALAATALYVARTRSTTPMTASTATSGR